MSRTTFFRQSGWMMVATVISGVCMFAVHFFAKLMPNESEYGIFGTMVSVLYAISIPALGLQMVFAQQTSAVITEEDKRRLSGTIRGVLLGTFVIWLGMVLVAVVFRDAVVEAWKLSNVAALWLTLFVGLAAVWQPMLGGLLQGQQNFFWFGWASILNGAGRLAGVAVVVLIFKGGAAGMVVGILLGTGLSMLVYLVHSYPLWKIKPLKVEWMPWLKKVIPLTLGNGAFLFMFTADPMFVRTYFEEGTGHYNAAGTLGRALVTFTVPVVWVMFPKIVRSVVRSEKTDVLWLTLLITGGLGSIGALGLCFLSPFVIPIVYNDSYLVAVPLLRWFSWSMVPLVIANGLMNNLYARDKFGVVPWLVVVAGLYGYALTQFHDSMLQMIQVLGCFSALFLLVITIFSWKERENRKQP